MSYSSFYSLEFRHASDITSWLHQLRTLKGRYCNLKPAQVDFPPVPKFSFTNLALIIDTTETSTHGFSWTPFRVPLIVSLRVTITHENLFECITSKKRIMLLEGRPECGKNIDKKKKQSLGWMNHLEFCEVPVSHSSSSILYLSNYWI